MNGIKFVVHKVPVRQGKDDHMAKEGRIVQDIVKMIIFFAQDRKEEAICHHKIQEKENHLYLLMKSSILSEEVLIRGYLEGEVRTRLGGLNRRG